MAGHIDQFLARQKQLQDDLTLSRRDGTLEGFKGLSLQRLITLSVYGDDLPDAVQDAIRIAKKKKEDEGSPADRSAATAASALDVAKASLKTSKMQRWGTIVSATCAAGALIFSVSKSPEQTEISHKQYKELREEIVKELSTGRIAESQLPSASQRNTPLNQNPFVPSKPGRP